MLAYNKVIIEVEQAVSKEDKQLFEEVSVDISRDAEDQPVLTDLHPGQCCVAQYLDDKEWYRGKVFRFSLLITDLAKKVDNFSKWFG